MAGKITSTLAVHIKFVAVAALVLVNLMAAINGQDIGGDDQLQTDQPPAGSPPPGLPPILLPSCNCWNYFTGSRCDNETFWRVWIWISPFFVELSFFSKIQVKFYFSGIPIIVVRPSPPIPFCVKRVGENKQHLCRGRKFEWCWANSNKPKAFFRLLKVVWT